MWVRVGWVGRGRRGRASEAGRQARLLSRGSQPTSKPAAGRQAGRQAGEQQASRAARQGLPVLKLVWGEPLGSRAREPDGWRVPVPSSENRKSASVL